MAVASTAVCVVAVSGCRACDEGRSILGIQGGTTLTGPDRVKPGESVEFAIGGSIGPKGARCPKTVGLVYAEVDSSGKNLRGGKSASKGASAKVNVVKVKKQPPSRPPKCAIRTPMKLPISISPGRQDEHKVRLTATIYPPPPPNPLPGANEGLEGMVKVLDAIVQGEAEKVVTVEGTAITGGPRPNDLPVAAFIPAQDPAVPGQPLALDARQSADSDGSIVRYDWDMTSDGTFEKSSASPTGQQVDSMAAPGQEITLRVTDDRGSQGLTKVSVRSSSNAITGGTPTLTPEVAGQNRPVTVGVKTTTPSSSSAELFCADVYKGPSLANPVDGQTFSPTCSSSKIGFNKVGVRYSVQGSSFPYDPTTYFRLYEVKPPAAGATARASQTAKPLAAQLRLTGATVRRLGKLKLQSTTGTVKGMIATGSGRGSVPKETPKRYRSALQTLASGRFALKFSGAASLESSTINLRGSATMLVRSRSSRRTQMCLSVKAGRIGGPSRFTVRGATGKASGFAATGTGPALSFDDASSRTAAISLKPRKGKARKLSRACRSLSNVLDGKLPKAKKRKTKTRKG